MSPAKASKSAQPGRSAAVPAVGSAPESVSAPVVSPRGAIADSRGRGVGRLTLREQVFQEMRHRIISGAIAPGEHLVETRLSQEFNISRGPLREGLRLLEQEGLVVSDGRGHLSVRETTASEIIDVFEVRTSLEAAAMIRLTRRPDREAIAAELREVLEPLRHFDLDFDTQIEVDLAFHERICELSGNNTLTQMWHQIMGHIRMMIVASGAERATSRMRWQDHVPLADAIASGDENRTREVIENHMQDFCRRYAGDAMEREVGL